MELKSVSGDCFLLVSCADIDGENVVSGNWNHIEDLDDFFTRVYNYHQRGGYICMTMEDVFQLVLVILIVPTIITSSIDLLLAGPVVSVNNQSLFLFSLPHLLTTSIAVLNLLPIFLDYYMDN